MEWKGFAMSFLALSIISFVVTAVYLKAVPLLFPRESVNYLVVVASYIGLVLLSMICYLRTMFSDPGSTERSLIRDEKLLDRRLERLKEQGLSICDSCKCYKPERAHHCSQCARCIYKMDHHCPWVNNCIGAYNQKHFVLFLFYITVAALYSLLLCAFAIFETAVISDLVVLIVVLVASAGFGGFTFQLLTEQGYYIWTNTSIIDILQGREVTQVTTHTASAVRQHPRDLRVEPAPLAVPHVSAGIGDGTNGATDNDQGRVTGRLAASLVRGSRLLRERMLSLCCRGRLSLARLPPCSRSCTA